MEYIWRVTVDRYGRESETKSGFVSSIFSVCEMLINKYEMQENKPIIEVVNIGLGRALADMLEDKKISFRRIDGLLMRINGADVFKYKTD